MPCGETSRSHPCRREHWGPGTDRWPKGQVHWRDRWPEGQVAGGVGGRSTRVARAAPTSTLPHPLSTVCTKLLFSQPSPPGSLLPARRGRVLWALSPAPLRNEELRLGSTRDCVWGEPEARTRWALRVWWPSSQMSGPQKRHAHMPTSDPVMSWCPLPSSRPWTSGAWKKRICMERSRERCPHTTQDTACSAKQATYHPRDLASPSTDGGTCTVLTGLLRRLNSQSM